MTDLRREILGLETIPSAMLGYTVPIVWGNYTPSVDLSSPPTIYLPQPEGRNAQQAIPFVRAFLDHEVAHLKFTDGNASKAAGLTSGEHLILNAIEDGRVNRLIGEQYPGCKINIAFADDYYMRQFAPDTPPIVLATVCLISMAQGLNQDEALECIGGNFYAALLLQEVANVTALFPQMVSTADAAVHAKAIYERWAEVTAYTPEVLEGGLDLREQNHERESRASRSTGMEGQPRTGHTTPKMGRPRSGSWKQGGAGGGISGPRDSGLPKGTGGRGSVSGSRRSAKYRESTLPMRFKPSRARMARAVEEMQQALNEGLREGVGESLARAITETVGQAAVDNTNDEAAEFVYTAWTDEDRIIHVRNDYDPAVDALMNAARAATGILYQNFVDDLLQTHRDWYRHLGHGSLDPVLLHRVGYDTKIFRKRLPQLRLDTAMTLLIDYSGSMLGTLDGINKIDRAVQLALLFSETAGRLEVPNEVLGYTTADPGDELAERPGFQRALPVRHLIVKEFAQSFEQAKYAFRKYISTDLMMGNIDGEAICWAAERLRFRPERKKIIFVLTDGVPCTGVDSQVFCVHLRKTVVQIERQGITCIAVGIESPHVAEFYKTYTVVESAEDLVTAGYREIVAAIRA